MDSKKSFENQEKIVHQSDIQERSRMHHKVGHHPSLPWTRDLATKEILGKVGIQEIKLQ